MMKTSMIKSASFITHQVTLGKLFLKRKMYLHCIFISECGPCSMGQHKQYQGFEPTFLWSNYIPNPDTISLHLLQIYCLL
uniref:Uncharacterized protein n=1 Tax=Anguilla anguilla TaxID=7936 RepID=A0A0E9T8U0_ANGAN